MLTGISGSKQVSSTSTMRFSSAWICSALSGGPGGASGAGSGGAGGTSEVVGNGKRVLSAVIDSNPCGELRTSACFSWLTFGQELVERILALSFFKPNSDT